MTLGRTHTRAYTHPKRILMRTDNYTVLQYIFPTKTVRDVPLSPLVLTASLSIPVI